MEAFQKRLKDVAGFEFVPPRRNRNKAVVYYLFLAPDARLYAGRIEFTVQQAQVGVLAMSCEPRRINWR